MSYEKVPMTFEEHFYAKFRPKNYDNRDANLYPCVRHGAFAGVPFKVIETQNVYKIEMNGKVRRFTNAMAAARWVKKAAVDKG